MNQLDIDKAYISPYDRFLCEFDKKHAKSASQLQEIHKYQRIFALRDNPTPEDQSGEIWENF